MTVPSHGDCSCSSQPRPLLTVSVLTSHTMLFPVFSLPLFRSLSRASTPGSCCLTPRFTVRRPQPLPVYNVGHSVCFLFSCPPLPLETDVPDPGLAHSLCSVTSSGNGFLFWSALYLCPPCHPIQHFPELGLQPATTYEGSRGRVGVHRLRIFWNVRV